MKPSCAVMKLTLFAGPRPPPSYMSMLPEMRVAIVATSPRSPRTNRRTSSRKRPFQSDQREPGNWPTS